jgi:hypothetical protein
LIRPRLELKIGNPLKISGKDGRKRAKTADLIRVIIKIFNSKCELFL